MRKTSLLGAALAATMAAGALGGTGGTLSGGGSSLRRRTHTPMMVTSPPEEIAAWNDKVRARNTKRHLTKPKRRYDNGQHPQFPKDRVHKQHKHSLRDEHGAYTLVGRDQMPGTGFDGRRMWLAGISAQRGY
jgi:hypothetical protein